MFVLGVIVGAVVMYFIHDWAKETITNLFK